ncbi:hypothetical protein PtB15_8B516 [Puccinia triticina]|nr:hypothetical protein PtB15_8B516 [Puccinia triticina]
MHYFRGVVQTYKHCKGIHCKLISLILTINFTQKGYHDERRGRPATPFRRALLKGSGEFVNGTSLFPVRLSPLAFSVFVVQPDSVYSIQGEIRGIDDKLNINMVFNTNNARVVICESSAQFTSSSSVTGGGTIDQSSKIQCNGSTERTLTKVVVRHRLVSFSRDSTTIWG